MPTPTKGPRLGGGPAHERHILANLATSLFEHRRITTTEAKAKRLRPLAERMITFAKRGDLHARRRVMTVVKDKSVVHSLFTEIAPLVAERPGGYTRITKVGARKGDNAPMAVIELVLEPYSPKVATVKEAEAATRRSAATGATASTQSAPAAEAEAAAADAVEAASEPDTEATVDAAAQAEEAAEAAVAADVPDAAAAEADAEVATDTAEDAIDAGEGKAADEKA